MEGGAGSHPALAAPEQQQMCKQLRGVGLRCHRGTAPGTHDFWNLAEAGFLFLREEKDAGKLREQGRPEDLRVRAWTRTKTSSPPWEDPQSLPTSSQGQMWPLQLGALASTTS